MPNIKSAKKRLRQSIKRRTHNRDVRSSIRTVTKTLLNTESADEAEVLYRRLTSMLDRAARTGLIARNAVDRRKASLSRHVKSLSN
ncbi:MAG: 30S ribosomal protein S20 [Gemmatimonadales bacterium]|nr:MAG: 30S ribosomal protein S20 [Gemmatimonadales bacterium]